MRNAADTTRGVVKLARLCFGERDQLLYVLYGQRWVRHEEERNRGEHADRREVVDDVVWQFFHPRRADRHRTRSAPQKRVAVRLRLGCEVGADDAARPVAVHDDDLLAQQLRHAPGRKPREGVGRRTRRERHDDGHRFGQRARLRGNGQAHAADCDGGQREPAQTGARSCYLNRCLHARHVPYSICDRRAPLLRSSSSRGASAGQRATTYKKFPCRDRQWWPARRTARIRRRRSNLLSPSPARA